MDIKIISILIIALLNIFLGLWVYNRNRQNLANINYGALCVSGGLWAIAIGLIYFADNNQLLQYALKGTYIFALLPPLFYLLFAYYYPYKLWNYHPLLLKIIIAIPLILEILFISGVLNLQTAVLVNGVLKQDVFFKDFLIFTIYFLGYIVWALVVLFKKFNHDIGLYKIRVKYLLIATISTFIIIGVTSIILPLLNNFTYDNLGPFFILIHFVVAGYLLFYKVKNN